MSYGQAYALGGKQQLVMLSLTRPMLYDDDCNVNAIQFLLGRLPDNSPDSAEFRSKTFCEQQESYKASYSDDQPYFSMKKTARFKILSNK